MQLRMRLSAADMNGGNEPMRREDLGDLIWFLAVAEERSFTRAAARLGTSQSTLSHAIRQLEARLGLRLLTRTTRSVAPTEAGERLLASLAPHVAGIEDGLASLMTLRERPSGTVRISVSDHAFATVLWPRLRPVLEGYPDIHLEFSIDNVLRNIVEERFDAGVRLGESLDKDMIAVRVSPDWRLVAVAAPAYFATRSQPLVPRTSSGTTASTIAMAGPAVSMPGSSKGTGANCGSG